MQLYVTCVLRKIHDQYDVFSPHSGCQNLVTANDATTTTVGKVRANFKIGGCVLYADFYVIDKLTQDVILGVNFFERSGALLDYKHKCLTVYDGTLCVPLVTAIDATRPVEPEYLRGTRP